MTEIFKMPDIGEGMHEGDIANWLVKVGDVVKEDDPIAEVQNDKLMQEILSPYSGTVTKLFVEEGTTVEVDSPLVEFDGDGSGTSAAAPSAQETASSDAPSGNAQIFTMPDIGEGMHEGDIANWLVKVGDEIKEDDPVAEVQNDKLMQEILSPYSGKVTKLFVEAGTTVEVGAPLIEYNGNGESSSNPAPAASPAPIAEAPKTAAAPTDAPLTKTTSTGHILAMPSVRHYARKAGIDLTQVPATGRHGHTTLADVKAFESGSVAPIAPVAPESAPVAPAPKADKATEKAPTVKSVAGDRREAMNPTRKVVSKVMTAQHTHIPPVTNFDQVEVSKLVKHRAVFKEVAAKQDIKLTYLAYVAKALATTAHKFPEINASVDYDKQEIVYHEHVNLGIAVNAPTGLYVPVIHEAETKSILEIAKEIAELATATREGTLKPQQMQGSTITISNIGSARGSWFTPIINGSDVVILGLGSIVKEPIVNGEGEIVVGQNMKLSMTYDHRLIDGMLGQTSLNYLKSLLADPEFMLMEI
ncbi:acetoin/pyruvate dehydrogenase complex, E2 component, dihydrolipoamide succinyltransferase [Lactococcus cremoris subsp. cremoris SK11]|uniref:Dihydrolipoamide acetyltransferase component of pyruvate dehydrogenase complex n=2 Tax=Lactococcus lactis subsp. cremoris TaxID=1359 RepID=Q033E5_LACLS|nr:2-oxo acid dehydrogenase subunit E2 [Lactococcus cremoris]ABJ71677.1 acetoin/pyruvate dehydrogenase complex, E2 component, dihydrolipoamide succinyltransferase [Lactococcus cremoris subsp. cremoris SK11]AEU39216.1 Dihydrolipoamide acetyltransferase component (E2) of acetoin dehydrogenase complex [Lactococcus cremoris subsp. cremoris A76]ARE22262.1 2-oxo acid dehydrogenase subunit E2 [Lactococcus cremoris]KZK48251.1 Dihydrolipoamide acetyltransferase component (E2) of acetoin dehydrogenase co